MKKKFVVYANCQGRALAKTLLECQDFSYRYEWIPIKPVHTIQIEEIPEVLEAILSADLVIAQPISSQGRDERLSWSYIKGILDSNVISLTFPSLYFNGYFPHIGTFKGISSPFGMTHDFVAGFAFCEGLSVEEATLKITSPYFYPKEISNKLFLDSIDSLREREVDVDVPVSNFIQENAKSYRLFRQFNRPTPYLFEYIATEILNKLNVVVDDCFKPDSYLNSAQYPILNSIRNNLGIVFEDDSTGMVSSVGLSMCYSDVLSSYYEFYSGFDKVHLREDILSKCPFIEELFS